MIQHEIVLSKISCGHANKMRVQRVDRAGEIGDEEEEAAAAVRERRVLERGGRAAGEMAHLLRREQRRGQI